MEAASLQSARKVIDVLGGTAAVARLTGRGMAAVSGWKKSGRLPADTFLILTNALTQHNYSAPSSIWGIPIATSEKNLTAPRRVRQSPRKRRGNGAGRRR